MYACLTPREGWGRCDPGGRCRPRAGSAAPASPGPIVPLLFGPFGIGGLAERHPDVYPGPNEALMRALFPPVRADLLTFYLP